MSFTAFINQNPALLFHLLLIPFPTLSVLEFVPLLVLNFQLVAYPLWPPSFVLGVEVAFVVWDVLWRCVRVTISAVFGTVFASCGISFPFLIFLSVAAL